MIQSSIKIMGKTFTAKGKTVETAILNLKPDLVKGMGVLILKKGDVVREKVLTRQLVAGLFGQVSRLGKEIAHKNINQLFPDNIFE